jgi:predicted nucleic acid-binding protein
VTGSGPDRAVLDANVLYSNFTRDLLLSLFAARLYEAKWTDEINDEWVSHLLENRSGTDPSRLRRTVQLMNAIRPNPLVDNYKHLINSVELPDPDDRHVLAAAIACGARKILTWNLKDFPARFLSQFGIAADNPDRFIAALIHAAPERVVAVFKGVRLRQKKPKMEIAEFFDMLRRNRLNATGTALERFRDQL